MYTYCPKDSHYVLGHRLIYMPILIGHVLWCLGLTHGCLVPNVQMPENICSPSPPPLSPPSPSHLPPSPYHYLFDYV